MTKIEEIEKLLEDWKAARDAAREDGHTTRVAEYSGIVRGLTTALRILDQPSNTQIQLDTTPCIAQAHSVYRINGAKYCKDCGQALSDSKVP